jgi:hypothetical protein
MTVHDAFENLKGKLELPDRRRADAAAAQEELRERISRYLDVPRSFLTGSYSRYTKLHPLNDIDVFLVRNSQRVGLVTDGSGTMPGVALDEVETAVRRAYPSATTKRQSRSINVEVPGVAFGFDLVPAWYRSPNGYWIPDADNGRWLPTDPEQHGSTLTAANERTGGRLVPLVKMAKHWSRQNYDLFRSFHLELICQQVIQAPVESWQAGMARVLVGLQAHVGRQMLDPVYGVSRVDKELSAEEHGQLLTRVQSDAASAIKALELEVARDHAGAIEKWRRIFLSGF